MSTSKLDAVYRSILLTKFFTKGWGKPENLKRLFEFRKVVSNRDECFKLVERDYPVTITKEQTLSDSKIIEGYFITPLEKYLPGIVPEIAQKAHFQAILPIHWPQPGVKPMCLHLAGTGDHFFWRRRNLMVKPLLKEAGIGGIILENPFYGLRKPTDQVRSSLHNVSDIFVMGGCLILESLVLFHWCERNGLGPLGVTGLSMGGHMASLAATNWPKPLVLVPCLSWSTASAVFLQGVMSQSINWDLLEDQYLSDGIYREKLSKMVTIIDEAFLAGKKFARTYSEKVVSNKLNSEPILDNNSVEKSAPDISETAPKKAKLNTEPDIAESNEEIQIHPDKSTVHMNQTQMEDIIPVKEKGNRIIDVSRNFIELQNTPKDVLKPEIFGEVEELNNQLKEMVHEGIISRGLYDKLTSNQKFELDPEDIVNINQLHEVRLREVLLKCKLANNIKKEIVDLNSISPNIIEEEPSPGKEKDQIATESAPIPEISSPKNHWNVSDLTRTDLWFNWPFNRKEGKKIDISKIHWRDREALQFMRGVMDECTHLSNFTIPFDTSLIIAVCAKHDAYVPRDDVGTLEEIWPGAEVRYVDAGHVSAYILHQSLFRSCIKEAFERSKKKWKDGRHINDSPTREV
ncbi:hypothetical protein O0L34_g14965 [Tuta absoluta]|nr:hypothetical protein O0L34_g14965 [Tuta absoluta]